MMNKRKLGSQGLEVSELGLGCMGMTWAYGSPDEQESLATLDRALELGINFFDTAEAYGPYKNEELLGRALKGAASGRSSPPNSAFVSRAANWSAQIAGPSM